MPTMTGTRAETRSLARIPLFASLDVEELRALDARCLWRKVAAGEWVIDYQAEGVDVFFVFSGLVRVVIITAGREMILRDIRPGEYFGQYSAIDGKPRSAAIVAVTDSVVARMSATLFWEVIHRHASVREGVLKALVADARALNQRANEQANFDVRHRLCAELLRLSRSTGEGRVVVSPPPTHAELAARISTHREAVTKTLSALEKEGLIERGHAAIVLTDPGGLRRVIASDP
jgi:CRP-like cAMP-binding protein